MNSHIRRILVVACLVSLGGACSADSRESADPQRDLPFWSVLSYAASEMEQYSAVSEMAADADLVVLGSIESVGPGRVWGSEDPTDRLSSLVLQIRVDQRVAGAPTITEGDLVSIEHTVFALAPNELRSAVSQDGITLDGETAPVPRGQALWFLRLREDIGTELIASPTPYGEGGPYRLVSTSGVITRLEGGAAMLPLSLAQQPEDGHDPELPEQRLLDEVESTEFDQLVRAASS